MAESPNSVAPGTVEIWWQGQGTFVFEGHGTGPIVIDPFYSDILENDGNPQRLIPIPVAPKDLRVSAIFLTHDHRDHTDPETLPDLCAANPDAPIYAVPASVAHLARLGITGKRVHTVGRNETVYGPGYYVHTVPAKHTEDSIGLIFVFEPNGPVIYHTADTEYFPEIIEEAEPWGVTLLSICINGKWGNMGIADAVRVTNALHPREVLPMHWGMFAQNTADPQDFVRALAESGSPAKPIVLENTGLTRYLLTA